ncbi:hypothetical protein NDU88_008455 [Pleurodeles waltl]|uniref:Uncharacterized protein n=1 Tax=Pleurodeles waltl TaxID=8319 RepID=A0AAV7RVT5_PLEWA|nr:hypothetical protein NDU88_008455 [Pleurodeles waltl]
MGRLRSAVLGPSSTGTAPMSAIIDTPLAVPLKVLFEGASHFITDPKDAWDRVDQHYGMNTPTCPAKTSASPNPCWKPRGRTPGHSASQSSPMTPPNMEQIIENKRQALQAAAAVQVTTVEEDDDKGLHIFATDDETKPTDESQ